MIVYTPPRAAEFIPVIDLEPSFSDAADDRRQVAWEIHKACVDTGFFYVRNHGIPDDVLKRQLKLAAEFFTLSAEEKMSVDARTSPCMRGYEAMAAQTLDNGSPPDLKEGFLIGPDLDADHPYVQQAVPNCGANQWPQQPTGFREQSEEYVAHMVRLGRHLLGCLALSLDLAEDYFAEGLDEPFFITRMLHYPAHPDSASFNQLGAGAHTDWGLLTMLLQDDVGGLEVRNADGDWIAAPPIPGALIINLGEMMPVLTNGLYRANLHRVLNNASGRSRYSVPTFFDPEYFYKVQCVPTCLPETGAPLFADTTVGEHIAKMYRKTYALAN